jgi:methylthioribose-1-phosphate isomerase
MTPDGVAIENPAFDVTPARYVTAIITERGVLRAPYEQSIQNMAKQTISEPEFAAT